MSCLDEEDNVQMEKASIAICFIPPTKDKARNPDCMLLVKAWLEVDGTVDSSMF